MARRSGILLHPTSLPGPYGIGDFGPSAFKFVDFLAESKQKLWQILPLGPTSYGDSPYQCLSALAGNPLLLSLDLLKEQGYLTDEQLKSAPDFPENKVDYGWVIPWKKKILREAFNTFHAKATEDDWREYGDFCREQNFWLEEYVTYVAIKESQGGKAWVEWPQELALRQPGALKFWKENNQLELDFHRFLQYEFYHQWTAIKSYANSKGISLVGDLPIFVAFDSADVWENQEEYELNDEGYPTVVAGVPPDYFSETGQLWGNPLYRWGMMAHNDYKWWQDRFRVLLNQVDVVRIDHYRGFEAYWEVPGNEKTAQNGRWVKGPGLKFFQKMKEKLGDFPILAEDLGFITPEVKKLREDCGYPGMRILQFAFDPGHTHFLPHNYEPNTCVYSGTHDNNTTLGWISNEALPEEKARLNKYVGYEVNEKNVNATFMKMAWSSVAEYCIVPLQDVLNLGEDCRMNFPGKAGGNWAWRYREGQLESKTSEFLADLTDNYQR